MSHQLVANAEIELLETATQSDTAAINLIGSDTANTIRGNDGANIIDGKLGNDVLTGFGGADGFQFTTALGASNIDTIIGFAVGQRQDPARKRRVHGPRTGGPACHRVRRRQSGPGRHRPHHLQQPTGQLYFDADGNGSGAAMQFATLSGAPALTASDFTVI